MTLRTFLWCHICYQYWHRYWHCWGGGGDSIGYRVPQWYHPNPNLLTEYCSLGVQYLWKIWLGYGICFHTYAKFVMWVDVVFLGLQTLMHHTVPCLNWTHFFLNATCTTCNLTAPTGFHVLMPRGVTEPLAELLWEKQQQFLLFTFPKALWLWTISMNKFPSVIRIFKFMLASWIWGSPL